MIIIILLFALPPQTSVCLWTLATVIAVEELNMVDITLEYQFPLPF